MTKQEEIDRLVTKYPTEAAEIILSGCTADSPDFTLRLIQKRLINAFEMKQSSDTKGLPIIESTAPWLTIQLGQSVRLYPNRATALIRISIDEREVELLIAFLQELQGWKEQ